MNSLQFKWSVAFLVSSHNAFLMGWLLWHVSCPAWLTARSCNRIVSYFGFYFFKQVTSFSFNNVFREESMQFPVKCVLHVVKLFNQDFINRITLTTISVLQKFFRILPMMFCFCKAICVHFIYINCN